MQAAVKLMYAGAAVSAAALILWLAIAIADVGAAARGRWLGHNLTAGLLGQLQPLIITMLMVTGVVMIALWLWMARANGRGRDWARITSTVLSGLAALELISILSQPGSPCQHRRPGTQLERLRADLADHPRGDLPDRPGRGVAALAPGLHRVLQATPHPGMVRSAQP